MLSVVPHQEDTGAGFFAISRMLAVISSAAVATDWTLRFTSSEAADTTLAWADVVARYRGSILGPFWITLSMALMVGGIG